MFLVDVFQQDFAGKEPTEDFLDFNCGIDFFLILPLDTDSELFVTVDEVLLVDLDGYLLVQVFVHGSFSFGVLV